MPDAARPVDPNELLTHVARLRALARRLIADSGRADDLVQQAMLAALERPPRVKKAFGPWLAGVVRNLARRTHRADARRHRHEAAAPCRSGSTLPDDVAARAEALKDLADAVHELEPALRDVIVLHYLDGLTMREVAARLGAPVETLRTRLKRALAHLRARLDAQHGGDGRSWGIALLPLAWKGGVLVKGTTKAAIAAALLLLVGAAALWPTARVAPEAPSVAAADATSDRAAAGRTRARAPDAAPAQEDVDEPAVRPESIPRATLRGVVADEQTRKPIPGARVTTMARSPDGAGAPAVAWTDASGRFELAVSPGRVLVRTECEGWYQPFFPYDEYREGLWRSGAATFDRNAIDVPAEGEATVEILLARTGGVAGRVLLLDGTSVPGAEVVVQAMTEGGNSARGTADAEGRFRILGVAPGSKTWLQGSKSGLVNAFPAVAVVEGGRVTEGTEIRMRTPPVVTGRIISTSGKPVEGAQVQVVVVSDNRFLQWGPGGEWLAWSDAPRTPVRPDGTYETPVWPVHGEFEVRAICPGHSPARSARIQYSEDRDVYRVDLALPDGAAFGGRVTAKDTGVGIAGARVFAGPATNPMARLAAPLRAVCDADGRFALDALPPETYVVSVSADGYVDGHVAAVTTPAPDVHVALAPALSISGTVRIDGRPLAGALVGVQPQADEGLALFDYFVNAFAATVTTADDGSFRVPGLVAGAYRLHVRPSARAAFRARFTDPVAAGSDDVVVEVAPLATGEALDPYASMSNRDLGCAAAGLNLKGDFEGAIERWKSLLARSLTRNERAAALIEYANPLGNLGRGEEQDAALREALDLAGAATARAWTALSRLAWSRYWAGDSRAALDLIRPVTSCPDPIQAAGARWSAAKFAAKLGDLDAARGTLTVLRDELARATDSRLLQLLPQVERSLKALADR